MAFATAQAKIDAVTQAGNVLGILRTVYQFSVQLQAALTLYEAGTDPTFNAAFNALFSAAERQELAAMIGDLSALVTGWQVNHPGAITL